MGCSQGMNAELHKQILGHLKENGYFLIGYAGSHGVGNALGVLLEAAQQIDDVMVKIILIGKGPEKQNLEKLARGNNLENVIFLPSIPKVYMPDIFCMLDVLYIGIQKQNLFRFGVSPNKLMDYMMAGRPIISAIDAGNDLVKDAGCGVSVPAENAEAIAEAMIRIKGLSLQERNCMGENGRNFVLKNHNYKVLAKEFLLNLS